jgi:hypothetical protein
MADFKKTIAAVQKRERCNWEIGDALIDECGPPSEHGVQDGSHAALKAAAAAIEAAKVEGYTANYLARLRIVSFNFPKRVRRPNSLSWEVHASAGTPEMLDVIVEAAGKKPVTQTVARTMRKAIDEQQDRKRRRDPDYKTPPKTTKPYIPTKDERKGLALIAEVLQWAQDIKAADKTVVRVTEKVEKHLPRLVAEEIDYLVDISLTLAEDARKLGDVARKLRTNKRTHLSVVGEANG